jgi:UDP-glucose 4-epimerase
MDNGLNLVNAQGTTAHIKRSGAKTGAFAAFSAPGAVAVTREARMKILVTGAGVIGCHTVRQLAEQGHDVTLVDVAPNMPAVTSIVDLSKVPLVNCDVTDIAAIENVLTSRGVERVIHTAALMTAACRADPRRGLQVNAFGTTNLLDCARRGMIDRIVLSSSNVVEAPSTSVYALSKYLSEQVTKMYRQSYGVKAVSLRYAAVFGAWNGPPTSIPARLMRMMVDAAVQKKPAVIEDPLFIWKGVDSFVDARDCAAANVAAALADNPVTAVYDVAPAKGLAFEEIVSAIHSRFPDFNVDYRVTTDKGFAGYPVKDQVQVDNEAAKREIGFTPRFSIRDTVDETARFAPQA